MNNRPIVAASDDPADLEAFTSNQFLLQRKVTGLPAGVFVKEDHLDIVCLQPVFSLRIT